MMRIGEPQLGPHFMVRAAAWPLEHLDGFGEPQRELREHGSEADLAYEAWLDRERQLLHSRTAFDPQFLKALALTNPDVAARAARLDRRAPRNKRVRHLETTLIRYLCRAVTRTTPCDLWAGVTLGSFGEEDQLRPAPAARYFAPDLRPLIALFECVVARPAPGRRFSVNVTARLSSNGIEFWTASSQRRHLEFSGAAQLLASLRETGVAAFQQFAAAYARSTGASAEQVTPVLTSAVSAGLLLPSRGFPNRFSDPWQALAEAESVLTSEEGVIWRDLVQQLRVACDRLASDFESLDWKGILSLIEQCRAAIDLAARKYGATIAIPRTPVRVDLVLGHELMIGPESRTRFQQTMREYHAYQDAFGPAPSLLQASRGAAEAALANGNGISDIQEPVVFVADPPETFTWEEFAASLAIPTDLVERITRFSEVLSSPSEEVVVDALPAAGTAHHGDLAACFIGVELTDRGARVRTVNGEAPHGHTLHARFASRLAARTGADVLTRWLHEHFERSSEPFQWVELAGAHSGAPNALARPDSGLPVLDLWHADSSDIAPNDITFRDGQPMLRATERRLRACWLRSAGAGDVFTQTLAAVGSCPLPPFHFEAAAIPTAIELERKEAPRVRLQSGASIRPRRHFLAGSTLRALLSAPTKARRFRLWLSLAEKHRWPRLVRVRCGHRPSLVVPTRSPLAIEALFEGLVCEASRDYLLVEHFDTSAFLVIDEQHFAAELVLFNERYADSEGQR